MTRLCLLLQSGGVLLFPKFIKIKTSRFIPAGTGKKLSLDYNFPKLNQKLHFLKSGCGSADGCFLPLTHQGAALSKRVKRCTFSASFLKLLPESSLWQTCKKQNHPLESR